MRKNFWRFALLFGLGAGLVQADGGVRNLDWMDLLPEAEQKALLEAEQEALSALPDDSLLLQEESAPPPAQQAMSPLGAGVVPGLDGQSVRIAGFVAPVEFDAQGKITEFFLVPYFGACIHVPPPPPNQTIYVVLEQGLTVESMYVPYWVGGRLRVETVANDMAQASYKLQAEMVEEYREE